MADDDAHRAVGPAARMADPRRAAAQPSPSLQAVRGREADRGRRPSLAEARVRPATRPRRTGVVACLIQHRGALGTGADRGLSRAANAHHALSMRESLYLE